MLRKYINAVFVQTLFNFLMTKQSTVTIIKIELKLPFLI